MHSTILRGLSAACLCLAAALPAQALVITQTANFGIAAPMSFFVVGGGVQYAYTPFNPALGTLTAVNVSLSWTGSATVIMNNPYATPMEDTPFINIESSVLKSGTVFPPIAHLSTTITGPTAIIPGLGSGQPPFISFAQDISGSRSSLFTTSNELSQWINPATLFASVKITGSTHFGSISGSGNGTLTLAYTYQVPEAMPAGAVFAACLGMLGWLAHRGHRLRAPIGPRRAGL